MDLGQAQGWWRTWSGVVACTAVTALCMVAAGWLGVRSQQSSLGQALDERAMDAVAGGERATARMVGVLGYISIVSIVLALVALVAIALLRRRYSAAVAALSVVIGANVTTQVYKRLLDRGDFGHLTVHSFPSGHATVVTSVVLASLLVAPSAARAMVTLIGSGAMTVTAAATLVASWHRPSDVVGAALVSLAWAAAVAAVWGALRGGVPSPKPGQHRIFAIVGVVIASVLLVVAGVRPGNGWSGFLDASVVLVGLGLVSGLVVTVFAYLSAPIAVGPMRQDRRASSVAEDASP